MKRCMQEYEYARVAARQTETIYSSYVMNFHCKYQTRSSFNFMALLELRASLYLLRLVWGTKCFPLVGTCRTNEIGSRGDFTSSSLSEILSHDSTVISLSNFVFSGSDMIFNSELSFQRDFFNERVNASGFGETWSVADALIKLVKCDLFSCVPMVGG